MAFNPFHYFRKHQKAIFAVVTIVIMFVFILQFGRGDAFERMLYYVGAGKARGTVVATLNGTKVREVELEKLARHRRAASDFLFRTAWDAHPRVLSDLLSKELKTTSKDLSLLTLRAIAQRTQTRHMELVQFPFQVGRMPPQFQIMMMQNMVNRTVPEIERDLTDLEIQAGKSEVKDDEDRLLIVQKLTAILGFQLWLTARPQNLNLAMSRFSPEDLYFGGGYKTVDERLDFILWKQQADRLGIQLSDADLAREINREAAGFEVFEDPARIDFDKDRKFVDFVRSRRDPGLNVKDMVEALRDEFRVVMAQGILVGLEPGVRSYRTLFGGTTSPAAVTPDEFLNFFREYRTKLRLTLLAVPAEKFIDKVKETPTERQLRDRYNLFKEKEPLPTSRDPGFKEPRRIVVEYVTASPEDPFYHEQARKQAQLLRRAMDPRFRAGACYGAGSFTPLGAGPLGAVLASAVPLAFDPVQAAYQNSLMSAKQMDTRFPPAGEELVELDYQARLDLARVARPTGIASLVGVLAGPGNGFTGLTSLYAGMYHDELFGSLPPHKGGKSGELGGSVRQGLSVVLGSADPQQLFPLLVMAATGPAERGTGKRWVLKPETLSPHEMTPVLQASLEERLAVGLLKSNLETITTELEKLRSDPKKADEYLAKAVKEYHLARHQMKEPMSQHTMLDRLENGADIGINGLKDAFQKRRVGMPLNAFVDFLFERQSMFGRSRAVFEAEFLDNPAPRERAFLHWLREDLPARVRPFEAVRADVVHAWKMEKARQLARQAAEEIEATINNNRKKWTPADAVRYLREKQAGLGPLFELDDVSQFVQPRDVQMVKSGNYQRYQVPEDRAKLLPHAPPDMVRQFLTLEQPGDATVIADLPAKTFYVAVLMARDEPTVKDFSQVYALPPRVDLLYRLCRRERMEEYRRSVLEQLRRESGAKLDKDGRYQVPDEIRQREAGGRSTDVEE
jgi:hypothetical protein